MANGKLFDDVIAYKANENTTFLDHNLSCYWLKKLSSYLNVPYKGTLSLDMDTYPCPDFETLFKLGDNKVRNVCWHLPSMKKVDLALGIDEYPIANLRNHRNWLPGDRKLLQDFLYFAEQNTGMVLLNFYRPLVHTFAHFEAVNDQCPFRVALYRFRRLFPEFKKQQIPMHTSCRNHPGKVYACTDGFKNGKYPIQPNGKHCGECRCTPFLINHNGGTHFLTINGRLGWDDDPYFKPRITVIGCLLSLLSRASSRRSGGSSL